MNSPDANNFAPGIPTRLADTLILEAALLFGCSMFHENSSFLEFATKPCFQD